MKTVFFILVIIVVVILLGNLAGCTGGSENIRTVPPPPSIDIKDTVSFIDTVQSATGKALSANDTFNIIDTFQALPAVVIDIKDTVKFVDIYQLGAVSLRPVINFFIADPDHIFRGGSSVLSWSTSGATTVALGPDIGTVAAVGRRLVSPFNTTTYTLKATNSYGSVTATVTVTVTIVRS